MGAAVDRLRVPRVDDLVRERSEQVGADDRPLRPNREAGNRGADAQARCELGRRQAARRTHVQEVGPSPGAGTLPPVDRGGVAGEEAAGVLEYPFEDLGDRSARRNRREQVVERLGDLAPPVGLAPALIRLAPQPSVLDDEGGFAGDRRGQVEVALGYLPGRSVEEGERAVGPVVDGERDREHGLESTREGAPAYHLGGCWAEVVRRIGEVGDDDRAAGAEGRAGGQIPSGAPLPGWQPVRGGEAQRGRPAGSVRHVNRGRAADESGGPSEQRRKPAVRGSVLGSVHPSRGGLVW